MSSRLKRHNRRRCRAVGIFRSHTNSRAATPVTASMMAPQPIHFMVLMQPPRRKLRFDTHGVASIVVVATA